MAACSQIDLAPLHSKPCQFQIPIDLRCDAADAFTICMKNGNVNGRSGSHVWISG